jgi:sporulation protein YlmC with PRC-barrel domain
MIRLSQLTGQRVLTRDGARQLGSIRRLLLDPARGIVVSAELEGGVGEATMLDWESVASIGPDAVMVESEDVVRGAQSDIEQRLSTGELDLRGKQVLDEGGDSLGPLDDLEFDEASGRLARIHVPGHALPMERLIAVGPDAIIVPRPH